MKKAPFFIVVMIFIFASCKDSTYGYIPKGATVETTFGKTEEKSWETVETIEVITSNGDTISAYVSPSTFEGKYFVMHRNAHPAVKDLERVFVKMSQKGKYNMITKAALKEMGLKESE